MEKPNDWLASQLFTVYQSRFSDNLAYLESKANELKSLSRLEIMHKIGELDRLGQEAFSKNIGINEDDLTVFLRVLREL